MATSRNFLKEQHEQEHQEQDHSCSCQSSWTIKKDKLINWDTWTDQGRSSRKTTTGATRASEEWKPWPPRLLAATATHEPILFCGKDIPRAQHNQATRARTGKGKRRWEIRTVRRFRIVATGRRCESARDRRRKTEKFFAGARRARSRRAERGGEQRIQPRIRGWRGRKGRRRGTERRVRGGLLTAKQPAFGSGLVEDFLEGFFSPFLTCVGYAESDVSSLARTE